jgi:hypothetical protein
MVKPLEQAPTILYLEEVAQGVDHEVFMEVDLHINHCWLFIRDFRPSNQASSNSLFNIIIILNNCISLNLKN